MLRYQYIILLARSESVTMGDLQTLVEFIWNDPIGSWICQKCAFQVHENASEIVKKAKKFPGGLTAPPPTPQLHRLATLA